MLTLAGCQVLTKPFYHSLFSTGQGEKTGQKGRGDHLLVTIKGKVGLTRGN